MTARLPRVVEPSLEAGGVVQLRSGGFSMVIESVADGVATCVWADKQGKIRREQLAAAVLKRSTEGTDMILVVPGLDASEAEIDEAVWGKH
ncbi:MAG: DUF2158 domain-containing protein [Alphaproteobacteria bacterium]|nr:DUF2158 domain-containing protein [Alphaproteobacteria bacterium]MBU0865271.1 DUF2158 domain-containing protein [Alphaproteobacteria bacterium]MBU1824435.1 DUF2158 domain-containing protein [Alphaproteobacteria bacterium]